MVMNKSVAIKRLSAFVVMICFMLVFGTAAHAALQGNALTPTIWNWRPGRGSSRVFLPGIRT